MNFNDWYEANKESLAAMTRETMLKKVWEDGFLCGFKDASEILQRPN